MCDAKQLLRLFSICVCLIAISFSTIVKNDYGYENIVVAVHRNVTEDPRLLTNLKELITKASEYLFKATGRRVYLKSVTIVVPSTWSKNSSYQPVFRDYFSESHIRINDPNPEYGDTPYTLQPGDCGEPGEYIHMTPKFINELKGWTADMFGQPERQLVHEWAHFRYGVFDEYGTAGDEKYPMFYQDGGKIYPTSCTKGVKGWIQNSDGGPCYIYEGGVVSKDCIFLPNVMNDDISASIMYMPFIPSIEGFCEDDGPWERRHNWKAPSKQNDKCRYRSTWDIISNHNDFKKTVSHPGNPSTDPTFRIVQVSGAEDRRSVLVLDNSNSMKGKRINLLRLAATRFVEDILPDKSFLGIVVFNTWAHVAMHLTKVTSSEIRRQISNELPKITLGGTAIGAGLLGGLQVLRENDGFAEGGLIILITDGEETEDPTIQAVLPDLVKTGVIVNTVAFGPNATIMLEELSKATGGRSFFFPDLNGSHNSLGLESAFMESISTQVDIELQPVTLYENNVVVPADGVSVDLILDVELGKNTLINVKGQYVHLVNVMLESPTGKIYNESSPEYDVSTVKMHKLFRFSVAKHGLWKIHLKSIESTVPVSVTFTSEARDARQQPIRVKSWISDIQLLYPAKAKIYAKVTKGFQAVINATVRARVERPYGDAVYVLLKDNGAGADSAKDDGLYSAFFTKFNGGGRYAVVSTVVNNGQARLKHSASKSVSPGLPIPKPKIQSEVVKNASSSFVLEDFVKLNSPPPTTVESESEPASEFIRNANAGSFRLAGWEDTNVKRDVFPPNRVQDLAVSFVNVTNGKKFVTLTWTEAGDDYDTGKAAYIEIRTNNRSESLLKNFKDSFLFNNSIYVHEGNLAPSSGQSVHRITLVLPDELSDPKETTHDYYFAVVTVDDSGHASDVSNIVSAHYGYGSPSSNSGKNSFSSVVTAVYAAVIVAVVMLATLTVVCLCLKRRKRMLVKLQY